MAQVWEYVVDTYYTVWRDIEDVDVELNRIAGCYSGVWRDCDTELTWCFFYRRNVSFGFSHGDVAKMFVSGLPRAFGVSGVRIMMSDGYEHRLDLRSFRDTGGALLMNQIGR